MLLKHHHRHHDVVDGIQWFTYQPSPPSLTPPATHTRWFKAFATAEHCDQRGGGGGEDEGEGEEVAHVFTFHVWRIDSDTGAEYLNWYRPKLVLQACTH